MTRKLSFWEGIKAQFSTKCLVLIPIAVGINLIGGTLCSALKLPLFLDMIGTIVVACPVSYTHLTLPTICSV